MKTLNRLLSHIALRLALGGVLTLGCFLESSLSANATESIAQAADEKTASSTAQIEAETTTDDSNGVVTERASGLIYSGESGGMSAPVPERFLGASDCLTNGRTIVPIDPNATWSIVVLDTADAPNTFEVALCVGEELFPGTLTIDEQPLIAPEDTHFYAIVSLDANERLVPANPEARSSGYIRVKKLNSGG